MIRSNDSTFVPALRFRWLTPLYDSVVRLTTRERVFKTALVQQLALATKSRVLDIGCGTGTLTLWVQQQHPDTAVTGLDGDPQTLAIAANKARVLSLDIQWSHGLSYNLPFPDGSFDCVISSLFFHHLTWADKLRTAREMSRVLRPGGEIHIADWGRPGNSLMRATFFLVQLLDGFANTGDHVAGNLPRVFDEAGFDAVSITRQIDTPLGTIALIRGRKP